MTFAMAQHAVKMPFALRKIEPSFVNVHPVIKLIQSQKQDVSYSTLVRIALSHQFVSSPQMVTFVNAPMVIQAFLNQLAASQLANVRMATTIAQTAPNASMAVVSTNVTMFVDQICCVRLKTARQSALAQVNSNLCLALPRMVAFVMHSLVIPIMTVLMASVVWANVRRLAEIKTIVPMANTVSTTNAQLNAPAIHSAPMDKHADKECVVLAAAVIRIALVI